MSRKKSFPYPPNVAARITASDASKDIKPNAHGRAATFLCGISVKFDLEIVAEAGVIKDVRFLTNGCGFVVAAANVLAGSLRGKRLVDLDALEVLDSEVEAEIGPICGERRHCVNISLDAMRSALSDYRTKQVDEWTGDDALVCSCFGVSESEIEAVIGANPGISVEAVGDACNAGTGCGSCQQVIQEILDSAAVERSLQ